MHLRILQVDPQRISNDGKDRGYYTDADIRSTVGSATGTQAALIEADGIAGSPTSMAGRELNRSHLRCAAAARGLFDKRVSFAAGASVTPSVTATPLGRQALHDRGETGSDVTKV